MLEKLGYDVEIADEYDALYSVERFEPDLVVVNYIMQEQTGDKLIQMIKTGQPGTTCLLSSNNPLKVEDFKTPVDGILRTPVSLFLLKDVLSRVDVNKSSDINLQESLGFCPYCGKDIHHFEKVQYCPFCGEDLT